MTDGHVSRRSRKLPLLLALAAVVALGWQLFGTTGISVPRSLPTDSGLPAAQAEPEPTPDDAPLDLARSDLATLIAAGHAQLERNSLTRPEGANAVETWLAALAREPLNPDVRAGLEATLQRLGPQVALYLDQGRLQNAHDLHIRARDFATRAGLTTEEVWRGYKTTVRNGLIASIDSAVARHDRRRAERLANLAQEIDPDHPDLLPARGQVEAVPRRGDALALADGPPLVLWRAGNGEQPALAVMSREVSRGEYAAFARATGRAPARCYSPLSLLNWFGRRSWEEPGFAQDDDHPAVCVSAEDAQAYARWLDERLGGGFRLPTAEEWQQLAKSARGEACVRGHIDCGDATGTRPTGIGAPGTLSLHDLHGNVAEWLADCAEDCTLRLTGGASWRNRPDEIDDIALVARASDRAYDDVGFRLIRELGPTQTP